MERSLSQVAKRKDGDKAKMEETKKRNKANEKREGGKKGRTLWEVKIRSVTHQAALVWHRRLKVLMLSQNVIGNSVEFLLGKSSM